MAEPTVMQPKGPAPKSDQDVHVLDRLAVVYRYRHISVAVFVLSTLAVMIQGYTSIQNYRATARLQINDERSTAVPGLTTQDTTYYEDPEPYLQTQYRILRGRDLARRVVKKLQLQLVPEFNGTADQPSTPLGVLRSVKNSLFHLAGWGSGARAKDGETPRPDETPDESSLVDQLLSRVQVESVRGSLLVDVSVTGMDPQFTARAANALVEEYVDQNLAVKQQTTENMLEWLAKELTGQQAKVQDSERALAEYRDKQNALSLDDKQNIVIARLNQLNDAVTKAKTGRVQKESLYSQLKSLPPGASADTLPIVAQNPQIQADRGKLGDLQREKARLAERYGDKHPQIQNINALLADAQRQLDADTQKALQSVRNDYESALLEEQTLSRSLEGAKADASDLNKKSISYNVMEREANSNRQVYESLLQREKELRVASNSRANNVRVVDRAEVPKAPIAPAGRRTWFLALSVGLFMSVAVAFGLDYMNDTIKTPEDVKRRLKLTFLGLVPSVKGDGHLLLATRNVPHDFGESFRSLRTALVSKHSAEGTKIIAVTSAQPLEGKTTTAVNIAMALALGNARVLLVDADMRRPGLHRTLRLTNDRGLAQVLVGQARVRDVIQRTVDPNLLAVTAGPTPSNPSELLSSERMKTLLENFAHGPFDWVVIDTPPVLAVTDAVVLAPLVSGVVFVIGSEMTRRRLAERAVEVVMQNQPKSTSAILNKVDFERNKYYYSRYHGHQYKNYYAPVS